MWCKYFGTIPIIAFLFLSLTHFPQAQSWTQLSPTGNIPTIRQAHTAVYDYTNNRMIVCGGLGWAEFLYMNDIYVLSNANGLGGTPNWVMYTATGGPPIGRYHHSAVYDNKNNRMIIFGGTYNGGNYMNDVWVLSNANGLDTSTSTWTQLTPTGSTPMARWGHSAVYDSANNIMIIFAGMGNSTAFNDVWVLSHANGLGETPAWTQLSPAGISPNVREEHTAVYDTTNNRMTIFGGYYYTNDSLFNDVWVLDTANGNGGNPAWTQITTLGDSPLPRARHTSVYDYSKNRMIVYGGVNNVTFYNDVWILSTANGIWGASFWRQLSPSHNTLSPRCGHTAIYDSVNNRMTIFGGDNGIGYLNDTWVLTNANYFTSVPKSIWELLDK